MAENWAYAASKHAVLGVVRAVSREVGWEGIRINALCPGPTETGMTSALKDLAPSHYESLRRAQGHPCRNQSLSTFHD
jgi:meso-butanediol dehydrogenase/(S,S)-butanediol dehydrogenase/diacetyl reductase